ncbi:MAG: hypothetical protein J3R72DRAFT_474671 [Linnemannia gamsii]|nr:MAG: hypothetical protein J3R72DRAFT_474671 [Linnemannia gamsii]
MASNSKSLFVFIALSASLVAHTAQGYPQPLVKRDSAIMDYRVTILIHPNTIKQQDAGPPEIVGHIKECLNNCSNRDRSLEPESLTQEEPKESEKTKEPTSTEPEGSDKPTPTELDLLVDMNVGQVAPPPPQEPEGSQESVQKKPKKVKEPAHEHDEPCGCENF